MLYISIHTKEKSSFCNVYVFGALKALPSSTLTNLHFFWRGVRIDRPQTENVKTYSKGKSPWHFPHCCSKLKPCWKWKRSWNQIWRHSLYPHLHDRCEGKRRKVLPVRRWDWDCPEMREASDGTNLDEVLHHHEGKYGNHHAKYCCCDLKGHPLSWSAASPDLLWFSPFFRSYSFMIYL